MADLNKLTAALGSFDERMKAAAKPVQAPRLTYAEARADLEARARAGETTMVRDSTGRFTAGVKVFHVGPRPAAPAKAAKVEVRPAAVERDHRAPVALSAEA